MAKTLPVPWLWALREDDKLSEHARIAYTMLWTRGADAHPSLETLARNCGASRATTTRAVRELADAGWLTVESRRERGRGKTPSRYHLACPYPVPMAPPESSDGSHRVMGRLPESHKAVTPSGGNMKSRSPSDDQAPLWPSGLPDSESQTAKARTDRSASNNKTTANAVVGAYVTARTADGRVVTGSQKSRVGRDAREMLLAGVDPAELVAAAEAMGRGDYDNLPVEVNKRDRDRHVEERSAMDYEEVSAMDYEEVVSR